MKRCNIDLCRTIIRKRFIIDRIFEILEYIRIKLNIEWSKVGNKYEDL